MILTDQKIHSGIVFFQVSAVKNTDTPGYGYANFGESRIWIRKRILILWPGFAPAYPGFKKYRVFFRPNLF